MPIINSELTVKESASLEKAIAAELTALADEVDDETLARLAEKYPGGDKD